MILVNFTCLLNRSWSTFAYLGIWCLYSQHVFSLGPKLIAWSYSRWGLEEGPKTFWKDFDTLNSSDVLKGKSATFRIDFAICIDSAYKCLRDWWNSFQDRFGFRQKRKQQFTFFSFDLDQSQKLKKVKLSSLRSIVISLSLNDMSNFWEKWVYLKSKGTKDCNTNLQK